MRLVGWLGVVAVGAVLLLTGAEGADDRRPPPADAEIRGLGQRVATLEARLRVLEGAVQISGPNVKLVSGQMLTIQAGSNLAIQGSANVAISGGATVGITGAGTVDIRGGMLLLNPGGRPLARKGDTVLVDGKTGQITGGSATVLAQ